MILPRLNIFKVFIESRPVTEVTYLEAVYLHEDNAKSGDTVNLTLQMKNHLGDRFSKQVSFVLPEEVRKETRRNFGR